MPSVSRQKLFHEAIIAALKAAIGTSSTLTEKIADAAFYEKKQPWDKAVTKPGCIVTPGVETLAIATNAQSDYGLAATVLIVQVSNGREADADRFYLWRETAIAKFQAKRLAGMTDIFCRVEPAAVIDPQNFADGLDVGAFLVRGMDRRNH